MITLAQAQSRLQQIESAPPECETLPLIDSLGRVASTDVMANLAIPPSDNSAMDGFAINSADLKAGKTELKVSQRIPAGAQPNLLATGTAARIFTGGVIPDGADAVVIQENCEFNDTSVTVFKPVVAGDNIRPSGQDISLGARVIAKGQRLSAVDLSLLASLGKTAVDVFKPLRVAIFSTGDELVEPGTPLKPGQIYNSNRPLLVTLCRQLGFTTIDCGIVEDTLSATKTALAKAANTADVIISSGGVSVGDEDHIKPAVEALGSLELWKVQMKPGKPVVFGNVGGTPILGLPGNPVSSFVVFQLLGVPLLQGLQGQVAQLPTAYSVESGFAKKTTTREEYIRVKLERTSSGGLLAKQFANLSSGVMSSLSWADGLVRQDIDSAISIGQTVPFLPLNEGVL